MKKIFEYTSLAVLMTLPYLLVMIDNKIFENEVGKYSITAITHTLFLAIDIILLCKIKQESDLNHGLYLIIGLFTAMLIRENREVIRDLFNHHLKWYIPAILFSLYFSYKALSEGVRKPFVALREMHMNGYYNYIICGLLIVLVWSRLIGNRFVYQDVSYIDYSEGLKNTVEEPTQSLGYLIIMFGLVMLLKTKRQAGRQPSLTQENH
ncbi:hypothetical protein [Erwinia tasmaniensis]|uniref:hypothetical protein n=1 Tax=Erwinia tasmaniensis TaxID=338565 RepID=UPI003A4E1865